VLSGIIGGATAVALYCWESWDFETASYVEAIAATDYMQPMVGQRTPKAELSYTQDTQGDRVMVLEDVAADSCLEDSTAARHVERRLLAALSIRLYVNQRWIGPLVFHSRTPHSFS
jgi:hypoxanthine-guanine phosphoribosyltransferase